MEIFREMKERREDPRGLEELYRQDPRGFGAALPQLVKEAGDSLLLQAWQARLAGEGERRPKAEGLPLLGLFSLLGGSAAWLLFHFIEMGALSPATLVLAFLPVLGGWLLSRSRPGRRQVLGVLGLYALGALWLFLLPLEERDSILLAWLHLPVFLLVLTAWAYGGEGWRRGEKILSYLRFLGELGIIYGAMAAAGLLLSFLALGLFSSLGWPLEELYFSNVAVFAAGALFPWAAWLAREREGALAPTLARIFSPLILAVLAIYLPAAVLGGGNPFADRDLLLLLNGILGVVLLAALLTAAGRKEGDRAGAWDILNALLLFLALAIDLIALLAAAFRLGAYGLTPNRLAVLGANLLLGAHGLLILLAYLRLFRGREAASVKLEAALARFLPAYGIWGAFVAVAFPLLFP